MSERQKPAKKVKRLQSAKKLNPTSTLTVPLSPFK